MARVYKLRRAFRTDMRDYDTHIPLKATKVVNVTGDCSVAKKLTSRIIFVYAEETRGNIVAIGYLARRKRLDCWNVLYIKHFLLRDMTSYMVTTGNQDDLGGCAEAIGISKQQLRDLIETNAPAT